MMKTKHIILWLPFLLALFLVSPIATAAPIINQWEVIKGAYFSSQEITEAKKQIIIEAPVQAENAAIVPFAFYIDLARDEIDKVFVFADANPILLTATFDIKVPRQSFEVSTRVRLEKNSVVRVIVQTNGGQLLMKTVDIKTPGGGCGGGAMTDEAKLRASAGKMKVRFLKPDMEKMSGFVLNIKHPMRTGFERTFQGYYAKAWFIQHVDIKVGSKPYFNAILGPGISADPYFQFDLATEQSGNIQIDIQDNEGKAFQQRLAVAI